MSNKLDQENHSKLSTALLKFPHLVEPNKISLNNKQIKIIDPLPYQNTLVETLFLSTNLIKSVQGIQ